MTSDILRIRTGIEAVGDVANIFSRGADGSVVIASNPGLLSQRRPISLCSRGFDSRRKPPGGFSGYCVSAESHSTSVCP